MNLIKAIMDIRRAFSRRLGALADFLDDMAVALNLRQLFGLITGLAAVSLAGNQDVGSAAMLAKHGISPEGFAYVLLGASMLIVAFPKHAVFLPLCAPFMVLVVMLFEYVYSSQRAVSNLPGVIYLGLVLFAIVGSAREQRFEALRDVEHKHHLEILQLREELDKMRRAGGENV